MDSTALDRYVQLLQSPEPEKRRQAIVALGRSKNLAALRPLAEVYRNEQEAELRELALRAGQFIKAQATQAAPASPPPKPAPAAPAAPPKSAEDVVVVSPFTVDIDEVEGQQPVTPQESAPAEKAVQMHRLTKNGHAAAKQAKAYAEEALSLSLRGDTPKAIKAIKKAYQVYPQLMDDTYYSGLATTVLQCDEGEVLDYLRDDSRSEAVVKNMAHAKTEKDIQTHIEEANKMSWLNVSLDLIIFSLTMALGPVLLLLIVGQSLESLELILEAEGTPLDKTLSDILAITKVVDGRALLILGATLLVSGFISLIVQCVGIHFSATRFLGGTGTLRFLMYKLISYYNRILVTFFVVLMLSIWLFVGNGLPVLMWVVFAGLALFGLTRVVKLGDRIGEAYKFTTGGGCISVIIAGLVLVISNGAIAYIVYLVLSSVVLNLLPTLGQP